MSRYEHNSTRTYTYILTTAQCHVLACACEIQAQTLQELADDGNLAASKWASMLRELQVLLDVTDSFAGSQEGGLQ